MSSGPHRTAYRWKWLTLSSGLVNVEPITRKHHVFDGRQTSVELFLVVQNCRAFYWKNVAVDAIVLRKSCLDCRFSVQLLQFCVIWALVTKVLSERNQISLCQQWQLERTG